MRAFRGVPLSAVVDPRQAHPAALRALAEQAGGTLLTSSYLRRRHSLHIVALLATRAVADPRNADEHRKALRAWVCDLGTDATSRPLTANRVA
jgi:hypothetical protein